MRATARPCCSSRRGDIAAGEAITRDYNIAPRLPLDESDGPLRLLLQFGLPPKAWGEVSPWSESEE